MAAHHHADTREYGHQDFSEHNVHGQTAQQQQSLQIPSGSHEHGQQHAVPSTPTAPPLSPVTPPIRTQEVRVRCEAPDCQSLLQASCSLHLGNDVRVSGLLRSHAARRGMLTDQDDARALFCTIAGGYSANTASPSGSHSKVRRLSKVAHLSLRVLLCFVLYLQQHHMKRSLQSCPHMEL